MFTVMNSQISRDANDGWNRDAYDVFVKLSEQMKNKNSSHALRIVLKCAGVKTSQYIYHHRLPSLVSVHFPSL